VSAAGRHFRRDLVWNVGSLALAGVCGILVNVLIAKYYDPDALGIFNQVFAFYLLFSQVAVLGVHQSVLNRMAATDDAVEQRAITTSALVLAAGIGAVFATVMWLAAGVVGDFLESAEVARGVEYCAPGILFFALSKVALACLNGLRRMRWYAIFFAGRFVLMLIAFLVCAATGVDRATLPIILTVSEAVTFLGTIVVIRRQVGAIAGATLRRWGGEHLRFGVKGFSSGLLLELNTRVDILILGRYTSDAVVGAYSFAAILAEGFFHLLVVLRTNYAPIVIRLWHEGRRDELVAEVRRARNRIYLASIAAGLVLVGGYVACLPLVTSKPALLESWTYFAVLIGGMVLASGYAPFQPMLLYAGHPGWYSMSILAVVAINAAANLALIPPLGAIGSATGTAISFVAGVAILRGLCRLLLRLRL
jgi:O-antigen/teichoic acid export membrane protein